MANVDLQQTTTTDYESIPTFSVPTRDTDNDTEWQNPNWKAYLGQFKEDSDFQSAVILKAIWMVGAGYTADDITTQRLNLITGFGKDSFDDILKNMEITVYINGNAYAEIVRDSNRNITNLKPLNPGRVKHVVSSEGILKSFKYTQLRGEDVTIQPDNMFYLVGDRVADEIHGLETTEAILKVLTANRQIFDIMQTLMERQARPLLIWKLKTRDTTTRDAVKTEIKNAKQEGNDLIIPDEDDEVSVEPIFIPANAMQSPFEWRNMLRNDFYRRMNMPQILAAAGGQSQESESKVIYLGFEQIVRARQRYLKTQILNQLGYEIDLIHPASIQPGLQTDEQKDANQGLDIQQGDTTAGVAR